MTANRGASRSTADRLHVVPVEGAAALFTPEFTAYFVRLHDELAARAQALRSRRAERLVVELAANPQETVSPAAVKFLNRLSDFLFVAARFANDHGSRDVLWVPGQNR